MSDFRETRRTGFNAPRQDWIRWRVRRARLDGNGVAPGEDVSTWNPGPITYTDILEPGNTQGLYFKPDGTSFYVLDRSSNVYEQYDMADAWDVANATQAGTIAEWNSTTQSVTWSADGSKFYANSTSSIYFGTASTAWDITTVTQDVGSPVSLGADLNNNMTGMQWSPDGSYLFAGDTGSLNRYLIRWDAATAFDATSLSKFGEVIISAQSSNGSPIDISISGDGKFIYTKDFANSIDTYELTDAWDVTTATHNGELVPTTANNSNGGIHYDYVNGDKLFTHNANGRDIFQFQP